MTRRVHRMFGVCALSYRSAIGWLLVAVGCTGTQFTRNTTHAIVGEGAPVIYEYPTLDGGSLSAKDFWGRDTVLLFLTTYDAISLAASRQLVELWHTRKPRINILLVALEPPQNAPLVSVFRDSLANDLPVVLADQLTLNGGGGFGDVRVVPNVVLLDRDGRVAFHGIGVDAYRFVDDRLRETAAP